MQKKEGQLVDSPTRIDSFILLWSSKLFWGSSLLLLFNFEQVLRLKLDCMGLKSALTIDRSCVGQSTLIASNCNRSDRAMLLLALVVSFHASYDWNSWLHFPSCWPPPVPFPFLCMGNSRFTFVSTGRNGTKTSPFFVSYCTIYTSILICTCTECHENLFLSWILKIAMWYLLVQYCIICPY